MGYFSVFGARTMAAMGALALLGALLGPLPVAGAQPSVPDEPINVTATPGDAQVTLAWTPGDDNGSTIIRYEYTYDENDVPVHVWYPIPNSNRHTTGYVVTGLTNGTAYQFYLRAINLEGNGAVATAVSVPAVPATTPDPVTEVVATPGNSQATLTWIPGFDGGSPVLYYEFRQRAGNDPYSPWSIMVGSDATTTSYTVTGLTNGVTYRFQVRAVNAIGPTPLPTPPDPEPEPEDEEPDATEPEDGEPETTEPEDEEPDATEPEDGEPETTEPEDEEPDATEPEDGEPETTEPETTEPDATEPEDEEPDATEPEDGEPEEDEPEEDEPETTEPEDGEPEEDEPETTEPEDGEPEEDEPEEDEPEEKPEEKPEDENPVAPIVVPPAGSRFYSGDVITGPDFCTDFSLGGPRLYPHDADGDGVAEVCSLPYTRREAIARQNALIALANHHPHLYTTLVNAACAATGGTAPCGGQTLSAPPPLPPAGDRLYAGPTITGPGFCANRSLGGPTTYPHDSNGDGIADVCSLPYTRREAIARQHAGDILAKTFPAQFQTWVQQGCRALASTDYGDDPADLATDVCA